MPSTVLGTGDIAVSKTDSFLAFTQFWSNGEESIQQTINYFHYKYGGENYLEA